MRIDKPYLQWEPVSKYYDMGSPTVHTVPNNLMRNAVGHPATPASDFFPTLGRDGVLAIGVGKLEQWDDIPCLREYERTRIPKYGPQGALPPLDDPVRMASLRAYFGPFHKCEMPGHIYRKMKALFASANLRPWSFEQVLAYQIAKGKLSSAGGVPYNMKRTKGKDLYIQLAEKGVYEPDATVVANRNIRQKLRSIFMASMQTNERELRWIYPLMEWMKAQLPYFEAWKGQDYVEQAVTPWNSRGRTFISADYSAMDTTCGPDQFHMMYDLIKWAFPRSLWSELKADVMHAINVPKIVGVGFMPGYSNSRSKEYRLLVLHGTSANPSGDAWNQFLETVLSLSIWLEIQYDGWVETFQLIGDDSCAYSTQAWEPGLVAQQMSEIAKSRGMVMNPEKQEVSSHQFHYLQRYYELQETWNAGVWRGAYPLILGLNSAKNPERDNISASSRASEKRSIARIAIAENMKWHPHFHEIVDLFVEGDPGRLGLGTGLWEDEELLQEMRAHGQLQTGVAMRLPTKLSEFAVVKYLRER